MLELPSLIQTQLHCIAIKKEFKSEKEIKRF